MQYALTLESRDVALDLHAFLHQIDPARWRSEFESAARERLQAIEERLEALLASWSEEHFAPLRERIGDLVGGVQAHAPSPGASAVEARSAWMSLRVEMQPLYEALAQSLRGFSIHLPRLRPTNYARNAFHVASALTGLALVELVLTPWGLLVAAGGFAGAAWTLEALRRPFPKVNAFCMRLFRATAHPHEWHRVNSATWYATALVLLALTGSPLLCGVALAVLGLGDPAAALLGRRFGRTRLINGRTLEGSLAFVLAGGLGAFGLLLLAHAEVGLGAAIAIALGAAVAAALAELLCRRIDDNLAIPVAAAAGAWLAALAVGRAGALG